MHRQDPCHGPGSECADVLRQAAPPKPSPGRRNAEPMRGSAPRISDRATTCPRGLADLSHRVDEGDLGGQKRIGRNLGQFSGLQAGGKEPDAVGERPGVDLPENLFGPARGNTRDNSRWREGVRHRRAFPQKFRVPGKLGPLACCRQQCREPSRRAHGNGGPADDQARPFQQRGEGRDTAFHLGHVGVVTAGQWRSADADEVHVTECRSMRVGW